MSNAEHAARYCGFIRPDRTCALMEALQSEVDPRCKYWRDEPEQCRYLKYVVMRGRG